MTAPRPDRLFRVAGVMACGIVSLPIVAQLLAGDITALVHGETTAAVARSHPTTFRLVLASVPVAVAAVFGGAFWLNVGPGDVDRRRGHALGLLGLQAVIAAVSTLDSFFIIAAQVPFVFTARGAAWWLGGQIAVVAALAIGRPPLGANMAIPEIAGASTGVAIAVSIVYLTGWQVFAFAVGYLASSERRSRAELERQARELLATEQMLAGSNRVAERAEISRDLHDALGHSLTVLNVNLELASHLTDGRAASAIDKAQTVARLLLADVREVVHTLSAARVIDLPRALQTLTTDAHSPAITLSMPPDLSIDDPAVAHAVFRCVQESITNTARHAGARHQWIDLSSVDHGVQVHVRDDGVAPATLVPGHGLAGMRERIERVGGRLRVECRPGRGVTVDAWVPTERRQP